MPMCHTHTQIHIDTYMHVQAHNSKYEIEYPSLTAKSRYSTSAERLFSSV